MGLMDSPPFCKTAGCTRVPQVYIKSSFRCPSCAVAVQLGVVPKPGAQDSATGEFQGGVMEQTERTVSLTN